MLIKFFGGTGGGSGIANYLIDPERAGREGAAPKVVRGDIARTVELIDAIDRKWKYTTGVLSFAVEDAPTQQQQNNLMDDCERIAFAGLANDRFDITWVRHSHTEGGRVELHFLTPRLDIATGNLPPRNRLKQNACSTSDKKGKHPRSALGFAPPCGISRCSQRCFWQTVACRRYSASSTPHTPGGSKIIAQ